MSTVKSLYRSTLVATAPAAPAHPPGWRNPDGERTGRDHAPRGNLALDGHGDRFSRRRVLERGPDGEAQPTAPAYVPVLPPLHLRPWQEGATVGYRAPY